MQTLVDFDRALIFAIPTTTGGIHEGMLLEGPQGWGEFSPGATDSDAHWLTAAVEAGTVGWPDPVRGRVPVAVPIPAVDPEHAYQLAVTSGCHTADVRVAVHPDSLDADIARLKAVRQAVGPSGTIRCDAGGRWDAELAIAAIPVLAKAADGLEYVLQPAGTTEDLATIRKNINIPVAAEVAMCAAADIAVVAVGPLGGVRRALRVAEASGLPCVVSSPLQTSIGLAGGLALAGALPELTFACSLGALPALAGDVVGEPRSLIPRDGYLPVAPMPAAPDRSRLGPFTLTGDRAEQWRARLVAARSAR